MPTLKGRVLLGWMRKDAAINFLLNDCHFDPPIDAAAAEAIWQGYRDAVEALPDRPFATTYPGGLLQMKEAAHAIQFKKFLASLGHPNTADVKRIDLLNTYLIQHYVVTERSENYVQAIKAKGWLAEALPTQKRSSQVAFQYTRNNLHSEVLIDLPHAEFWFGPDGNTNRFAAEEGLRHVTATGGVDGRLYLTAGYHRCFAKALNAPAATVVEPVVAVALNVLVSFPNAAPGVTTGTVGEDRFSVCGTKAAKFGDFFTDGLFMDVDLRKKRYQLQVTANWVALDDPT